MTAPAGSCYIRTATGAYLSPNNGDISPNATAGFGYGWRVHTVPNHGPPALDYEKFQVILSAPLPPLTVTMTPNVVRGIAPLTVSFTASANQPIARYSWDFGDHAGSAGQNQTHRYNVAGTYMAGVTAFASDGRSDYTHIYILQKRDRKAGQGSS